LVISIKATMLPTKTSDKVTDKTKSHKVTDKNKRKLYEMTGNRKVKAVKG